MTATCKECGGTMATRNSRPVGSLIERQRRCKRCGYRDVALVRPETIVKTRCVYTPADPSVHDEHAVR